MTSQVHVQEDVAVIAQLARKYSRHKLPGANALFTDVSVPSDGMPVMSSVDEERSDSDNNENGNRNHNNNNNSDSGNESDDSTGTRITHSGGNAVAGVPHHQHQHQHQHQRMVQFNNPKSAIEEMREIQQNKVIH